MAFKGSSVEKSMAEPRWRSLLFSRKASHGLGVALIIFGSLQILVQTSLLILETLFVQIKDVHRVSCWISGTTGIWCGFGIVVGGVVAIVAGRKGTRSWIRANNIFSVASFLLACLIIVSSGFYVLDLISDRGRILPGNCENQTVSTALPIDSMLGSEMEATTQPLENPPSNRNVTSSGNLYWKTMSGSGTTKATISEDSSGSWRIKSGTTEEGVEPTKSTTTRSWWYLIEDYPNVDDEDNYIDSGDKKLSTATTMKPATHSSFDVFEDSGYGQMDDDGGDDDDGDYDDYFENYNVTRDVEVSSTMRSDRVLRIRREDPNLDREECLHQNLFWWIVALTHLSLLTLTGVVEVLLTVVSGSNSCLSLCRGPSEDLDHYIRTLSRPGSDEDCPLLTDLYPNKDDFTSARGLIDV